MWRLLTLVFCTLLAAAPAQAYTYRTQNDGQFTGYGTSGTPVVWHEHQVMMGLGFGDQWNPAAEDALKQWNDVNADFEWVADSTTSELCVNDGINSAGWSSNRCGGQWGSVVATTRVSMTRIGEKWYITDADVIFNKDLTFDNYEGPMRDDENGQPVYDFVRVALHEFGHAMGLLHPDELGQHVVSIMNSGRNALQYDQLQGDDVDGAHFLYGSNGEPTVAGRARVSDNTATPTATPEPTATVGGDLGGGGGGSLAPWWLAPLLLVRHPRKA